MYASGSNAQVALAYTVDNTNYTTSDTINPVATSATVYTADVTSDRAWTWGILLNTINFKVRVMRTSGSRTINVDAIYLRVTYGIDTTTEPWYTGSYASFPISLGGGTIQSVVITDEQGKVHLNTASQTLLQYLMVECGIASGTASTLAANIVSYRSSTPFNSVEELQKVSGMTSAYYNLISSYVTVYSYINTSCYRPSGARAPININTAPTQVLKAIFDDPVLGLTSSNITSLVTDITTTRAATPFTCFYTSNAAITSDFIDFINGRAYLSATKKNNLIDNADASSLIPISGFAGINCATTEFCYAGDQFYISSLSQYGGRNYRVKTIVGNDGSHTFTTYAGDATSSGYRKEDFE